MRKLSLTLKCGVAMNDKERERRIRAMQQEVRQEVSVAVGNIQTITKMISNGTGSLVYRAITGKK